MGPLLSYYFPMFEFRYDDVNKNKKIDSIGVLRSYNLQNNIWIYKISVLHAAY